MRARIAAGIAAAAVVFAGLTGCSVEASVGGKSVSKSELETKAKAALQPQVNVTLDEFRCQGGLELKTGKTQQCAIQFNNQWQIVNVTATDDDGKFNVKTVPGIVPQPEWAK